MNAQAQIAHPEKTLPKVTILSFFRSIIFYIVSLPSIVAGGFFLIPLFIFLPFKLRWFCLTRLLSVLILEARLICGIKYKITGLENLPQQPYVALSKHQSPWETFFLFILLSPVSTVMKRSLLLMPSFGWGIAMTKPIAIDRNKKKQALKQLLSSGTQRLQELKVPVLIYPEGTRIAYGRKGNYKRGGVDLAQKAAVPIVCFAHNAGRYWPSGKFVKHPGTIQLHISKPMDTSKKDAKSLLKEAEQWIESEITKIP